MGNMNGSYGSHYTLRQVITVNSQNIANNTSNVTVRMFLDFDGSSYYAYTNNSSSGNMTIEGTTIGYSINGISFSSGVAKSILLAEWTGNIGHNTDGTKILNVSGSWNTNVSRIGTGNCGTSQILPTIPRASSISCTTANVTETAIITINSSSPSFWHRVWVDFGNLIEVVISQVQYAGSFSWTIPENFYNQMPSSKSKSGRIYCRTYSGNTEIGLKASDFTVTTNEEKCKPNLTATVIDINEQTVNLTDNNEKLIKHKSNAKIAISTTAKNGASISTKKVNNVTLNGNDITIQEVETDTFVVTAIDSRGYSNSVTLKPQMIDYVPLSINANIKRTQPTTGEVDLSFTGNYFNENFNETVNNTLEMKWFYKEKNAESWNLGGTIEPTIDDNKYNNGNTAISLGKTFNYQKAYEFYLEIKDKLTTLQPTFIVTQGIPIFDWGKDFFNINGDFQIKGASILPVVLFDSENGTNESVNFNGSIEQNDEIEIIYCRKRSNNTLVFKSTGKLPYRPNMEVILDLNYYSNDTTQQSMTKIVQINSTGISVNGENTITNSNSAVPTRSIYIMKVLRYRKGG